MSEVRSLEALRGLSDGMTYLAERLGPSVVGVGRGRKVGSGVFWDDDGHVVTCNHNLHGPKAEVKVVDGSAFNAKIVGRDRYSDVALLKIDSDDYEPVQLHEDGEVKVGQLVFAAANPFGSQTSMTSGVVTTPRHSLGGWWRWLTEDVIVSDARLTPGYSGGPLVDASGKTLGLNAATVGGRAITVPLRTVRNVVDRLASEGKVTSGYLGIVSNAVSLPEKLAERPDVDQETGLMVFSVEDGTPAEEAGLAIGDVLVKFDDEPVERLRDLPRLLREDVVGKPVEILILRGGETRTLTITPTERSGDW